MQTTPPPASLPPLEASSGKIWLWSIIAALSGFLFGFDTIVISGVEQKLQDLWHLSSAVQGVLVGSALYGTVIGALIGGWPADRFGRKPTLLWIGLLYMVCALGTALAPGAGIFIAARFIGGLGIGISTVVAPMYIAEIAPSEKRGRLAGLFQFNIVLGIVVAYASNAALQHVGETPWRRMIGVAVIPSIIFTFCAFTLPESPRWLSSRGQNTDPLVRKDRFFTAELRKPILLAFFVAFFNQMSGINAILYFSPRIFEAAGLGEHSALLQSIGVGATNLIFTFVGLALIDRLGRRTLLYIGSFGYILSLSATAWAFFTAHTSIVPYCIFAFIAAHAIGQGTVIWVFIAEIFPNRFRAAGQTLGSSTHWVCDALLTTFFPIMVTAFAPGYVFSFFCGMMVLQLIWVATMVPETKGVSLEDLEQQIAHTTTVSA